MRICLKIIFIGSKIKTGNLSVILRLCNSLFVQSLNLESDVTCPLKQ